MSIDQDLVNLKKEIEAVKTKKIQLATKLKSLEDEMAILLKECESLGLDPQKIGETIKQLEIELHEEMKNIQQQLNLVK